MRSVWFALILNNPAFGVPVDFLYGVLWGFGIPAAASHLTPTAAGTALGVTLPKTTPSVHRSAPVS